MGRRAQYGEFDEVWKLYCDDNEPKPTSFVWSGIIKASYTGVNQIEKSTQYVHDIVAVDQKDAEQVARNLFDCIVSKKYPILKSIEVRRERNFEPGKDKDLQPHISVER